MRSIHHLVLSLFAAVVVVPFLDAAVDTVVLVALATVLGVAIDADHFVIAWYNTGSLAAVRGCVRDPRRVFLAQDEIFEDGDVWPLQRLLSHVVLAGALVLALLGAGWLVGAVLAAVVLYVHVLADLAWDVARQDRYFETVRRTT